MCYHAGCTAQGPLVCELTAMDSKRRNGWQQRMVGVGDQQVALGWVVILTAAGPILDGQKQRNCDGGNNRAARVVNRFSRQV